MTSEEMSRIKRSLEEAEAILVGAGAGLSAAAGMAYSGERFQKYFFDFADKYGYQDMYDGGFYPYATSEEQWAYWSRYIWINRYMDAPKSLYEKLLSILCDKNFFVLTTNVDHMFQRSGFPKDRLFYTQGDYGLWQCAKGCRPVTFQNYDLVSAMVISQGIEIRPDKSLVMPEHPAMAVPSILLPTCPFCGEPMAMNLRSDESFVEDKGWHEAAERYTSFVKDHINGRTVYLELGVGANTPGIIKYPFWRYSYVNENATYITVNNQEAFVPKEIGERGIAVKEDIASFIEQLA